LIGLGPVLRGGRSARYAQAKRNNNESYSTDSNAHFFRLPQRGIPNLLDGISVISAATQRNTRISNVLAT
jgi:hypothetical protein